MTRKWNVIDLCCGMGGLSYAAGISENSPVIGIDINPVALETYNTNLPRSKAINADVSTLTAVETVCRNVVQSNPSIIISGPPCQGFSAAGPRKHNDPRNSILLAVAKVISHLRPEAAVVENVSSIKAPMYSDITKKFRDELEFAGYHIRTVEINALDFGVPQRRKRVFFFILPFEIEEERLVSLLRNYHKKAPKIIDALGDLPHPPVWPTDHDNIQIANHVAMRHSENVKRKISEILPGSGPLSYRKLDPDGYAATLLSGHRAPPAHYAQSRSITVREALRLQGFPDDFVVSGVFSKQMEQVTNAVPFPLGLAVLQTLNEIWRES